MRLRDYLEHVPDTAAISLSTKTTVTAAGASALSSIADWNWTAIISLTIAAVGLLSNIYFQRRREAREIAEHKIRLKKIMGQCDE
ncbi:hypothetical protein AAEX37_01940 [Oligella sp. MSHR50489EDL]|uniref:hypothetical protein n=1 Tax=Oligella sp. MSHR50489EDL TaxID=3139409 RepID=UPI003D81A2B1